MAKRKKIIAIILIIAGVIVIAYPWVRALYFNSIQTQVMQLWLESVADGTLATPSPQDSNAQYDPSNGNVIEDQNGIWIEDVNPIIDLEYMKNNMEGIITIDKINLKTPILKGATKRNLDISICSVTHTGEMGEIGNYVLAGHKSRIYGRHFNRLLEVSKGDLILVENGIEKFEYAVDEVFSIDPSETWVLGYESDKKIITLITCDYRTDPVGRFIVRGTLIE